MDTIPDETDDIDMREDYTIDDLTQGIENLKVDPNFRIPFFRQGSSESKYSQHAFAAECRPYRGEERTIPNDEIIYVLLPMVYGMILIILEAINILRDTDLLFQLP